MQALFTKNLKNFYRVQKEGTHSLTNRQAVGWETQRIGMVMGFAGVQL